MDTHNLLLIALVFGLCAGFPDKNQGFRRKLVKKFVFECTDKSIRCPNEHNGECLPASWGCDGITDCEDGADEMDCDEQSESLSLWKPPVEESESEPYWNSHLETSDSDNSPFNPDLYVCKEDSVRCKNPKGDCIPGKWRCDHLLDCDEGEDEEDCDYAKRAPFRIEKQKRIHARDVFDSWSFFTCNEEAFNCTSLYGQCIPGHWACDGMADCNNGMDEANCPTQPAATTTESPSGWQIFPCTAEAFRCQNPYGECIPANWKCDGVIDCYEYEDEQDCYRKRRSTKVNLVQVKKSLKARRARRQH